MTASTSSFSPSPNATTVEPLPVGVWPVTATPVLIAIFFLPNERTTTLARSASSPGRIFGRPSKMVTSAPRSANAEANSHPIAPPPITAIRAGMRSSINTSSEVMIGPPGSKPGMTRGTLPAARTTFFPTSSVLVPSAAVTVTELSAFNAPTPRTYVTFLAFTKPVRPFTNPSTIFCLRACATAKSVAPRVAAIPNSAACSTWRRAAAVSRNALAGIHPRFKHVPPMVSFSTRATESPADAP
ncbi:unannotated protein [freshwater metagenome]|uniref:Unannotated protein n=1 Tax=freshwater metagenome TaxID=449393 RepID=A0A6J6VM74_9ZZZZ